VPRQEFERPTPAPFEAQFETWCVNCDEKIFPGEIIAKDAGGDWVHDHCVRKPAKELVICQTCWLVMPCGCDDVT
jgi:hypothetical protein